MRNFTASLKKEWLELTRTRRIWLYGLVIVVCLVCNWVLVLLNVPVHNSYTEVSYNMQTRYGAVVSFNVCVMTIYLLALLIMLRPIITGELKQKRLVQPFAMGLSPTANIVAKYIIQQVAPTVERMVKQFKGAATKKIGASIWQKSYIEHVIRDKKDYEIRSDYIFENPLRWYYDELYAEE